MYEITCTLKNKDVNLYRRLRTSRLMEILQEACIAHTEELGAGRDKTLDKGLLWVVIQQHIDIHHMPVYDDTITIQTWPGNTMHVLFPRFFRIINTNTKQELITGSSLWTLIDSNTRKMVFADKYGINIPGEEMPYTIPLPKVVHQETTNNESSFYVPFSYCDLNGHMNNTRYFDLAEDTLQYAQRNKRLLSVTTEYVSEAKFYEQINLSWNENNHQAYITGTASNLCFRMFFQYTD